MRPVRPGARLRVLLALSILPAFAIVTLSGGSQPTIARPPAPRFNVPAEAFRPVVVATPASGLMQEPLPARHLPVGRADAREASPPAGPTHVVRSGDSLWQIAAWHDADLQLILRWNPGVDPRHLVAAQRILVPGGRPMPVLDRATTTSGSMGPRWSAGATSHLWPLWIRGTITTRFSSSHPGIDIAAAAGTPVRAIAAGTVVWADWSTTGGGYVVEIRHPDGMRSRYLHNRKLLVDRGQIVAQGEQIATVGSTGWSTGPHLDLRIRMGGQFVNPLRFEWLR